MSRSRARGRTLALLLLLSVSATAVLLGRGVPGGESAVTALLPEGAGGSARTDSAAPDSVRPAKPKRQIVPDVEVVVNIPSGRLHLMEGGSVVASYPVSVGSARYPTPVGSYLLATVIWNPWWNPPPDSDWARDRKPTPPGPGNPMGRVKLHMDELIYIHGTTSEGRLGAPASHGCIRMSNTDVVDLARRLTRIAAPSVADAELDRLSSPGRNERHTVMARSIRMRVSYQVAEVRGDRLHVFPDVYGRSASVSAEIKRALASGGVDTASVPAPAMTRLRASAVRGGASFALADVPYLQPLPPEPPRERGPRVLGTPVEFPEAPRDTLVIRAPDPVADAIADAEAPAEQPADSTDNEP